MIHDVVLSAPNLGGYHMKLTNIRLLVNNFDNCFDFYSEAMGFQVTWGKKGDIYGSFEVNDQFMIAIYDAKLMDEHIGVPHLSRAKDVDQALLVFEVVSVDETYQSLKDKKNTFINEPHDMPGWGIRCVHLRDPEGNLIELNQELPKDEWSEDLKNSDLS